MFEYVKRMNEAFGNPEGDPRDLEPMLDMGSNTEKHFNAIVWGRLQKQCENIGGRFSLTGHDANGKDISEGHIDGEVKELLQALTARNVDKVRDALCDIMVFALGAYHFMGFDADADMQAVLDGVMTRFCKDEDALHRTRVKWATLNVTDVYTQGQFPRLCVKSGKDQRATNGDYCPKGKFLKSADYADTVFPAAPVKLRPEEVQHYKTAKPLLMVQEFPQLNSPQRRKDDKEAGQ